MLAKGKIGRTHLVLGHGVPISDCGREDVPTKYVDAQRFAVPAMADSVLLLDLFLSRPTVSLSFATEVIRNDVGLTIELLRLASRENVDADGFGIANTIVHVGIRKLSRLGSQIELLSNYEQRKPEFERFSSHARLVALLAEEHAYKIGCNSDEAYVAGLLLHMGELPALLGWDWRLAGNLPGVSATVAGRLGLPDRLVEILKENELQLSPSSRTLHEIIRVADRQARQVHGLVSQYARQVF